jgi:hypothetical protein
MLIHFVIFVEFLEIRTLSVFVYHANLHVSYMTKHHVKIFTSEITEIK